MKEESQDKRTAALKATLELISEQGFHGTPMSQIAERANIGVGTIYRYFSSKEELINALYIDIKRHMTGEILQGYSENMALQEQFRYILKAIVHFCMENPAELSFAEQYENSLLITAATHVEIDRLIKPITDWFASAAEQQLIKDMPMEMLNALIYGAVISLAKHYNSDSGRFDEACLDEGIEAIWDMIKR